MAKAQMYSPAVPTITGKQDALTATAGEATEGKSKPKYRLFVVRKNPEGNDVFCNLGGLWLNRNGKLSGKCKPTMQAKGDKNRTELASITLADGEFINCTEVE